MSLDTDTSKLTNTTNTANITDSSNISDNTPIWAPSRRVDLPRLDRDIDADVCVVGLGGSGLACVRALLDRGARVVGVDAVDVAAGAAGRNGGFLLGGLAMFHHDAATRLGRTEARAIYEATLDQIRRMTGETPSAVRATGSLRIATSEEELEDCALQFEAMHADGLPVERYRGPEGCGLLFPADAVFDPAKRCDALADDALRRGARLFAQSPVLAIDDGCAVTEHGRVRARHIVVAVDGRLEVLLPELSTRVTSARLQMLATAPLSELRYSRPIYARWGLDYWQQLADGRLALGGCRDVGGEAEWTTDAQPSEPVQSALTTLLRNGLHVDAPITHRWAATVGYTQSGMPILECVRPGVWAMGAYSGTGNVIGALCGRAVADVVLTGQSALADLLRA
ncbi:MAG TPA: FAD-binding oxidoreductase [Gemmatimonadaceae bacterium]|jgi:glycine/D-amino acid oxidase-like deaminating enzyme